MSKREQGDPGVIKDEGEDGEKQDWLQRAMEDDERQEVEYEGETQLVAPEWSLSEPPKEVLQTLKFDLPVPPNYGVGGGRDNVTTSGRQKQQYGSSNVLYNATLPQALQLSCGFGYQN